MSDQIDTQEPEVTTEPVIPPDEPNDVVYAAEPEEPVQANVPVIETEEIQPGRKQQRVTQLYPTDMPENLVNGDVVTLPANYDEETRKILSALPNTDLLDTDSGRVWAEVVKEGLELNTFSEAFVPTLEDDEGDFHNKVDYNGINLNGQAPKFKASENQTLKGDRAITRMISHLGLGTLFQVPLYHTGIWVTFKPPTESEIVELNRNLKANKIALGRYTYGLAFSNTTSYTIDTIMEFIMRHVYDVTVKPDDKITTENLREFISCQDIPSIIWGFICTMYPKGYRYRRACTANPLKCNHITEETLNISKLQWTNTNALTLWQKTFMSGRQSKTKDLASVVRYKEEMYKIQSKRVEIKTGSSNIFITLKTPSVAEYVEAGHRWIGDIVETVESALSADASSKERNEIIVSHGQASAMRQYSHWVQSLEYDTNTVEDRETIEKALNQLSTDDELRVGFIEAVVDYINKSTISVIGIPLYDCPVCQTEQPNNVSIPGYKNIIPLDMVQFFFGLISRRLERIQMR